MRDGAAGLELGDRKKCVIRKEIGNGGVISRGRRKNVYFLVGKVRVLLIKLL